LGISAGVLAGMALSSRPSWYNRLKWMAAALAWAGIAAWFVPTVHGVSLWSAYRQVKELHALPAGAVAEYKRGAPARQLVVEEFPSLASDLRTAKRGWLRRTVDQAIEKADQVIDKDPQTAFANLLRLKTELERLEHYDSVQKELESARLRAMLASARDVQQP
jgi:hypothetical protein